MGNISCKIDNGKAKSEGFLFWAKCKITECDDGYEEEDGKCVPVEKITLSGPCTLNPAVANALTYVYNSDSVCVVEKCEAGYTLQDGKCIVKPKPKTFPGWNQDIVDRFIFFDSAEQTLRVEYPTVESCAEEAEKRGGDAFTHRNSIETGKHLTSGQPYANTCVVYANMPTAYTLVGLMNPTPAQVTGCWDPSKTFPNCGVFVANTVVGYNTSLAPYQMFDTWQTPEIPQVDYTLKTCVDKVNKRGGEAFLFRNNLEPPLVDGKRSRNTCAGFGSLTGAIGGTMTGTYLDAQKSGCVDPAKTWPNCKK